MNARILLVLVSCALSVVIGLVIARGGAVPIASAGGRPLIGLSMDTLKEERWLADRDLFVAEAGKQGADVMVLSANGDDTRQLNDVDAMITSKVDALVIIPHNGAAMAKAVEKAKAAGIPVLSYDRLITGCDLDLYLTFDNVRVGELQAQFLADRLPVGKPLRVVRLYGSKTDNNAVLFKQGQDRVLQPLLEQGRVVVVHEDWCEDWKPENAKRIMNAAITKAGADFDAVLASNDGTAGGAIQALIEEGLAGKIVVTGQDADLAACQRIVSGSQSMTIYKPIKNLASRAAELAVKLAVGRPIIARDELDNGWAKVPSVFLDVIAVTKENMEATVIGDGFLKREDVFRGVKQP